jgi:hypothetical protein
MEMSCAIQGSVHVGVEEATPGVLLRSERNVREKNSLRHRHTVSRGGKELVIARTMANATMQVSRAMLGRSVSHFVAQQSPAKFELGALPARESTLDDMRLGCESAWEGNGPKRSCAEVIWRYNRIQRGTLCFGNVRRCKQNCDDW